jgi:hypothetical protein
MPVNALRTEKRIKVKGKRLKEKKKPLKRQVQDSGKG